ncbi:hypothetical protein [Frateuria sp. STR12]|uniref:hypothetical protein n=1 Tax=Frateuria hangzhouensis TaxID=2995589 RepID=UPI002260891B|nr:hypothetical protein [Frateuria sp. STR12]MCX7515143.1 hypothetical protein [Frateuria sp. STR12]
MQAEDPSIQINENRDHQRYEWRVERIGWLVMAILLAAGLLGLLGYGAMSRSQAGAPGALSVDYDHLQRASAPSEYRFSVAPSLASDGALTLRFDQALLDEVEMQSIVPEPTQVRAGPGFTEFTFAMAPAQGSPERIEFQFQHATFGHVRGQVTAEGAAPLVIDQFVYP